jgi:hypothetical protein
MALKHFKQTPSRVAVMIFGMLLPLCANVGTVVG